MNKPLEKQGLLTSVQVAQLLSVNPATVRRWTKDGRLQAIQFVPKGYRYYRKEDIEKLLKGKNI